VPGTPAILLDPRALETPEPARIACRTWTHPVVVTGWGAAVEGTVEIPPALEAGIARPPFMGLGAAAGERAPGARALLAALAKCIAHPATGALPDPPRRALVVGTHTAALHEVIVFLEEVRRVGAALVNPGLFPFTVMNAAAGLAAIHYHCEGPNITLNNGVTSALDAIACAADLVASGQADIAFAGGLESFGPETSAAFGRPWEPVIVSGVVAVTTPRTALALGGRSSARLLAFANGTAAGLAPAAAREKITSTAVDAVGAADAAAGRGPLEGPARDESRPELTLLALLEAVHRAAESPAAACVPVFAGPADSPSGGALVFGTVR
jgi:Beta-ketoacyl synthase, N-terminal domain